MNESEDGEHKYRCVNCGHRIKELYKTYSPTIQKLTECGNCKKVADKLIEFESLVRKNLDECRKCLKFFQSVGYHH